jgi:UDP-N-acetylglucosamine 2-epimerase
VNELLNNQSFYNKMAEIKNPYGDGLASKRIYKVLSEILE